jgi:hypothetical protein
LVSDTYEKVKQQLPTLTNLDGFLAAHQMGVTQLTVSYCNALVGTSSAANSMRDNFFSGFNFAAAPASAFNSTGRSQIIEPLLQRLLADELPNSSGPDSPLATQADPTALRLELNQLIDGMTTCVGTNNCSSDRTLTTVKATCAAALGSAVMLLQ